MDTSFYGFPDSARKGENVNGWSGKEWAEGILDSDKIYVEGIEEFSSNSSELKKNEFLWFGWTSLRVIE